MMEAVLVLALIAQRFRFTVVPGHPVEPLATFTLRPHHGIRAVVTPREGRGGRPAGVGEERQATPH